MWRSAAARITWRTRVLSVVLGCTAACASHGGPAGPAASTSESASPADGGTAGPTRRPPRTRGGAVVVTGDQRVAVVCHRTTGQVAVHALAGPTLDTLLADRVPSLDAGAGSEPWAAVIGSDDDTAYVLLRRAREVVTITGLKSSPRLSPTRTAVGSEPTAIAIQPSGQRLFVANFADGTLSVLDVDPARPDVLEAEAPIELHCALSNDCADAAAERSQRAHPRALHITDDGDRDDRGEVLYATEFFGQPRADTGPDDLDQSREGVVYALPFDDPVPRALRFGPITSTGYDAAFRSDGGVRHAPTGCYPNQLSAIAELSGRLVVSATCTSPAGPVGAVDADPSNFKTLLHPALFVLQRATGAPLEAQHVLLSRRLDDAIDADVAAGLRTEARRMPLLPSDLSVPDPQGDTLCLSAYGADAVFCTHWDARGMRDVGQPGRRALRPDDCRDHTPHLPIGLAALTRPAPALLAAHDDLGTLAVLSEERGCVQSQPSTPEQELDAGVRRGRRSFVTGLGVWSFGGEARSSCEGCHPDGWTDGVVWEFTRGPRRTLSLAGTFDAGRWRPLLWTASLDEIADLESVVRGTLGGLGAVLDTPYGSPSAPARRVIYDARMGSPHSPLLQNGLNGALGPFLGRGGSCTDDACPSSPLDDWGELEAYVKTVRAPRASVARDPDDAAKMERGRKLFQQGRCAYCHGGPGFTTTRLPHTPSEAANGLLPWPEPAALAPEMLGSLRVTPFAVPPGLLHLSPAARNTLSPPLRTPASDLAALYAPSLEDALQCALRDVGTYPSSTAADEPGLAVHAPGAPALRERRLDDGRSVPAIGKNGFVPPSLLGLSVGAPYFHAGNARTLHELFDPAFSAHHQAVAPGFLADPATRDADVAALVRYLHSLDDSTPPAQIVDGSDFCRPPRAQ